MSDMLSAPYSPDMMCCKYRSRADFCLALCLLSLFLIIWPIPTHSQTSTDKLIRYYTASTSTFAGVSSAGAPESQIQSSQVSRITLLEELSQRWSDHRWSETEAIQSGLLEPYADGKYHLDWPISRGTAARVFAKMIKQIDAKLAFPQEFADITASSPFAEPLKIAGQLFRPVSGKRFIPDQIFSTEDLKISLDILSRLMPPSSATLVLPNNSQMTQTNLANQQMGKKFDLGFPESPRIDATSGIDRILSSDVQRLQRLTHFVPADHLAPQNDFDLDAAASGLSEMETALDSFELTIYDVATTESKDENIESEIHDFLSQMKETLRNWQEKLRLSRRQLQAALLVDPKNMERCAELRSRIDTAMFRLENLSNIVEKRLSSPSPSKKEPAE